MGVGAGLYMYIVVVQKFTFAISTPDEFLLLLFSTQSSYLNKREVLRYVALQYGTVVHQGCAATICVSEYFQTEIENASGRATAYIGLIQRFCIAFL